MLLLIVLGPEADATDEEWPVDRASSIRMGSSETSVVGQHEGLEFPELLEEVAVLDLLLLDFGGSVPLILASCKSRVRNQARSNTRKELLTLVADDIFNKPGGSTILRVLVAVNLLLLECPLGESLGMGPQADLGLGVDQTEMSRLALPWLALMRFQNVDIEQGIGVSTVLLIGIPGRELLVGGHER